MAGLGDSFMLPKPGHDTEHVWVLITRPDPQTHEAIMVNVTTQRPHSDTTTILNDGEHPFVKRPSVIFYADARMVDVRLLEHAKARCRARKHLHTHGNEGTQPGEITASHPEPMARDPFPAARRK